MDTLYHPLTVSIIIAIGGALLLSFGLYCFRRRKR
jgi:LPXTG-motif cell wall-anchored protein